MTLRRYARARGCIDRNRHFRIKCFQQHGIGNHADVGAESHEFNEFRHAACQFFGEKAYADYCLKHINTLGIARLLSVKPEEAGDAVVRLKQKNIEMKKEIKQLKKELYALQGAPERK